MEVLTPARGNKERSDTRVSILPRGRAASIEERRSNDKLTTLLESSVPCSFQEPSLVVSRPGVRDTKLWMQGS